MDCPSCSGRAQAPAAPWLAWACGRGAAAFDPRAPPRLTPCAAQVLALALPALVLAGAALLCARALGSSRGRRRRKGGWAATRPSRPPPWAAGAAALAAIALVARTAVLGASHPPAGALVAGAVAALSWLVIALATAAAAASGRAGAVVGVGTKAAAWLAAGGGAAVAGPALVAWHAGRAPRPHRNAAADAWIATGLAACQLATAVGLCVRAAGRGAEPSDALLPPWLQRHHPSVSSLPSLSSTSSSSDDELGAPLLGGRSPRRRRTLTSLSSALAFGWVAPLIGTGSTRPLGPGDLFEVPPGDTPLAAGDDFARAWLTEKARGRARGQPPSLLRLAWALAGRWRWVGLGGLKAASDGLNFAGPLFLHALVSYVGPEAGGGGERPRSASAASSSALLAPGSPAYGLACAAGLAAAAGAKALLGAHYAFGMARLDARARAGLGTAVAGAALAMRSSAAAGFTPGDATTLATLDVDRVSGALGAAHEAWTLPAQILVALALLYTQVRWAFVAGLAVVLLLIPANRALATRIEAASADQQAWRGTRLSATADALRGAAAVKAGGWEPAFAARIAGARAGELRALTTRKLLDALCVWSWAVTSLLTMVATFGAAAASGVRLGSAPAFTCLALFGVLVAPLNSLPWVIGGLVDAGVSAGRLRTFLLAAGDGLVGARDSPAAASPPSSAAATTPRDPSPRLAGTDRPALPPPGGCLFGGDVPLDGGGRRGGEAASSSVPDGLAVVLSHASLAWEEARDEGEARRGPAVPRPPLPPPTLTDICLALRRGCLAVVVGDAGAGKSSLLAAMAGEMALRSGSVRLSGSLAYLPQSPWCASGASVRANIVLGGPLDGRRYGAVVSATALDADFVGWPRGDAQPVGDHGAGLSGGQRARVALARALYARRDVYLLDDPLSALDARSAAHVLSSALAGPTALLRGATRVIASHSPALAATADVVIRVSRGRVVSAAAGGAPTGAVARGKAAALGPRPPPPPHPPPPPLPPPPPPPPLPPAGDAADVEGAGGSSSPTDPLAPAEHRATGAVSPSVYGAYVKAAGAGLASLVAASLAAMQATRNAADWWLAAWVGAEDGGGGGQPRALSAAGGSLPATTAFYLTGLAGLAAANSAFTLVRAFSFAAAGLRAARRLHDAMVSALLAAPLSFFIAQPSGRILNRCAADVAVVDSDLPFIANVALASSAGLVGALAVLGVAQPALLPALLPLGWVYRALQRRYSASARELRRLAALARSPVVAGVADAVAGGPVLRSLGATGAAALSHAAALEAAERAALSSAAASQWLALRLQLIAAAVAGGAGAAAVASHEGWLGRALAPPPSSASSAGLVGLSLAYALPLTSLLGSALTAGAETEQELVSVERVVEWCGLEAEPPRLPPHGDGGEGAAARPLPPPPPPTWPYRGAVAFDDVWLRYGAGGPAALAGATFAVPAGGSVALAGRTGAGKSTALAALVRLADTCGGAITVDGVDVRTVPLGRLRSAVALVGQTPFVFAGTVRDNLDPLGVCGDGAMVGALKAVRLWDVLAGLALAQRKGSERRGSKTPGTTSDDDSGAEPAVPRRRRLRHGSSSSQPMHMAVRRPATSAAPPGGPPPRSPSPRGSAPHAPTSSTPPWRASAPAASAGWAGTGGSTPPGSSSLLAWHASTPGGGLSVGSRGAAAAGVVGRSPGGGGGGASAGAASLPARALGTALPPPPPPVRVGSGGGLAVALATGEAAAAAVGASSAPSSPDATPPPAALTDSPGPPRPRIDFFTDDDEARRPARPPHAHRPPSVLGAARDVLGVRLGADGAGLSAGQAQQLCLARALLKGAAVICLDEVTSVAEPAAASAIQAAVRAALGGTTVLQVAHSLDAVLACEAVVVMERGKVVESGLPGELVARAGSVLAGMAKAAGKRAE